MNFFLTLFTFLSIFCGNNTYFYLKVDTIERCLIDSFKKNQEVMIRIEVPEQVVNPEYQLDISIKDIEYRYYESEKFQIKNEQKKNIVYNHMSSTDVFVCLQSDREMYFKIQIDANIQLPENLIKAEHMYDFENYLYKTLQQLTDFNVQNRTGTPQDDTIFEDNIKLNNRLFNLTLFETFCIIGMGVIQYFVLRNFITKRN